ncbi:MAG: hypothetical protein AAB444_01160 [Patescibacteria group bacterium]
METIFVLFLFTSQVIIDSDQAQLTKLARTAVKHLTNGDIKRLGEMTKDGTVVYGSSACCADNPDGLHFFSANSTEFSRIASRIKQEARAMQIALGRQENLVFGNSFSFEPFFTHGDINVSANSICRWGIVFRRYEGVWKLHGIFMGSPPTPTNRQGTVLIKTPPTTTQRIKAAPQEHSRLTP